MYIFYKVHVEYARKPQSYNLTPSRKQIGKAVARGSRLSIATQCLKDADTRKHIIHKVGKVVQSEVAALCSGKRKSVFQCQSKEELTRFKFQDVIHEMQERAPTLLSILLDATKTRRSRPNRTAVITICTAMICKLRRPEMSVAQKILSLILYAGHSAKKVIILHNVIYN